MFKAVRDSIILSINSIPMQNSMAWINTEPGCVVRSRNKAKELRELIKSGTLELNLADIQSAVTTKSIPGRSVPQCFIMQDVEEELE